MDITEFSMRALNSEVQMIDDFNFFDQKVNSFKNDFDVDEQTISVWSYYILDLIELDKMYQEVIYSFCISIDNCVRYIISYSKDLAEYEMNLPEIMERVKKIFPKTVYTYMFL